MELGTDHVIIQFTDYSVVLKSNLNNNNNYIANNNNNNTVYVVSFSS